MQQKGVAYVDSLVVVSSRVGCVVDLRMQQLRPAAATNRRQRNANYGHGTHRRYPAVLRHCDWNAEPVCELVGERDAWWRQHKRHDLSSWTLCSAGSGSGAKPDPA